jgi:hypothetical protein
MSGYTNNDGKQICQYVAPAQAGLCQFLLGDAPDNKLTPWRIGNSAVRRNEAVVTVLADKWCVKKLCLHNDDPNNGLPNANKDFPHAFEKTSNSLPALSVVRVDGKWYVALA